MSTNPYAAPASKEPALAEDEKTIPAPLSLVRQATAIDWFLVAAWLALTMPASFSQVFRWDIHSNAELRSARHQLLGPGDVVLFFVGVLVMACLLGAAVAQGRSVGGWLCGVRQTKLSSGKGYFWRATLIRVLIPVCGWLCTFGTVNVYSVGGAVSGACICASIAAATTLSPTLRTRFDQLAGTRFVRAR